MRAAKLDVVGSRDKAGTRGDAAVAHAELEGSLTGSFPQRNPPPTTLWIEHTAELYFKRR